MLLCGGAGAETQASRKCCSEDKATDFATTDDFHDDPSQFSKKKGKTTRPSRSSTPALIKDLNYQGARNAGCLSGRPTPPRELPLPVRRLPIKALASCAPSLFSAKGRDAERRCLTINQQVTIGAIRIPIPRVG